MKEKIWLKVSLYILVVLNFFLIIFGAVHVPLEEVEDLEREESDKG